MTERMIEVGALREACQRYLQDREDRINRTREELIQSQRGPYRKWFRWRHRSRTEAIKRAREDDEWSLTEIQGGYWAQRAEEILSLCQFPGAQMVTVSKEDADLLKGYIPRKFG